MAIRIQEQAPSNSYEAVASYLSQPNARPVMAGVDLENLGASEAYPVYIADLDNLLSGDLPERQRYWRHLLVSRGRAVAEADVDAEIGRVVAIHRGPRAVGTAKAMEGAQELQQVRDEDYELRMLEAPAIHLVAIWLHSAKDDLLLPIEPDMTGLTRHRAVSFEEALPALREIAVTVKQAQSDYPGPSGN